MILCEVMRPLRRPTRACVCVCVCECNYLQQTVQIKMYHFAFFSPCLAIAHAQSLVKIQVLCTMNTTVLVYTIANCSHHHFFRTSPKFDRSLLKPPSWIDHFSLLFTRVTAFYTLVFSFRLPTVDNSSLLELWVPFIQLNS